MNGGGNADYENDSQDEGPVSSFQSYVAEGDMLAKQGEYRKAIDAYTKALTIRPTDKNGLVARSKCYLQMGDSKAALLDAEDALKEDPDFFKAKFQKAEALYAQGDFEMALVYYHRGNQLRPELDEFRLGIQKAREAIDNSIGNPKDYQLNSTYAKSDKAAGGLAGATGRLQNETGAKALAGQAQVVATGKKSIVHKRVKTASDRMIKQLLGELYADKEYLEQLMNDKDFVNNPNDNIYQLVSEGLRYLEMRTDFWRQQKPLYARKKEQSRIQAKVNNAKTRQGAAKQKKKAEHEQKQQQLQSQTPQPQQQQQQQPSTTLTSQQIPMLDPIEPRKYSLTSVKSKGLKKPKNPSSKLESIAPNANSEMITADSKNQRGAANGFA